MTFLVRVKMIDVLEKKIMASSMAEARRLADAQCWTPEEGWEHKPDFADAEIHEIRLVIDPK